MPRSKPEVAALQAAILNEPAVRELLACQEADGWITKTFHGYEGMEATIRLLCEKDLDPGEPRFAAALESLQARPERLYWGIGKVGRILDELGFGGSQTICAFLLAQAGLEAREPIVRREVSLALSAFRGLLECPSLSDFFEIYRDKSILRPDTVWPSIYHLRVLAFTQSWRSQENIDLLAKSVARISAWPPIPEVHIRDKGQLIASALFPMSDLSVSLASLTDAGWMFWFQRMELLARAGVLELIPALVAQVSELKAFLEAGNGVFTKRLSHAYFKNWGAYSGLMLERDWRSKVRRECDLTFRSLLILSMSHLMAA